MSMAIPWRTSRKFRFYARSALLVIDECGYLASDAHAADLLFEVLTTATNAILF